jgi:nucleoside-diphosphate-sugar epimerase
VELTPAGHALLERCEKIFQELEEAQIEMKRYGAGEKGCLRIGCEDGTTFSVLPPLLENFQKRDPFSAFYGETIRTTGTIFLPLGDARISHLDLRDLAEAAVAALTHARHLNKTYDLSGPEALHTSEVAEQIGSAIGRTIQYQPISVAAMEASLREAGMDPWFAQGLAGLYGWIRDSGLGSEVTDAAEQLLGRKGIPFRQFATNERSAWLE